MQIEHWMMFGTFAEQRHFTYPDVSTYTGVIINANMVAYAPEGLATFLCERTKLPYIIDPLTHAFQHEPTVVLGEKGDPKRAFKVLAERYGEPFRSSLGKCPVLPEDLPDSLLESFVARCLQFQRESLSEHILSSPVLKYMEDEGQVAHSPAALISPYFYLSEQSYRKWLPIMRKAAEIALSTRRNDEMVFASVVISRGILSNEDAVESIKRELASIPLDGFLLWIDDFNEAKVSQSELVASLKLAAMLKNSDRKVINLHGGFFSTLGAGAAGGYALTGVTHGPEFGESRAVVPVGGGIPIAKFYLPKLHLRLRYRDALALLISKGWLNSAEAFYNNVCDCQECRAVIGNDPANFALYGETTPKERLQRSGIVRIDYPTSATKLRCLRHYLNNKKKEFDFASNATPSDVDDELLGGVEELIREMGIDGVGNLSNWMTALNKHRTSQQ